MRFARRRAKQSQIAEESARSAETAALVSAWIGAGQDGVEPIAPVSEEDERASGDAAPGEDDSGGADSAY